MGLYVEILEQEKGGYPLHVVVIYAPFNPAKNFNPRIGRLHILLRLLRGVGFGSNLLLRTSGSYLF